MSSCLEAIISASRVVADRLDFLKGLEVLLFNSDIKEALQERKQLHRIVAEHTWIFGEQYNLTVDDESLTTVLKKHLKLLGEDVEICEPVLTEDHGKGIVDLMLSRLVPQSNRQQREHLVIELKRPTVKVNSKTLAQTKDYAFAVASDERFKDTETRWVFWAVSNEVSDNVRREARQRNRPEGLVYDDADSRITVWVRAWGEIIEDCRARMSFFEEQLQFRADNESGMSFLRKIHEKYLPTIAI